MGFFGSVLKDITGGSGSKSSGKNSSASGYNALPSFAQADYKNYLGQVSNLYKGGDAAAYTPLPQTASETQGYNLNQLPTTQAGVTQLTDNYLNPLTSYLTAGINQNYNQQGSSYLSNLASDGQNGSNREFLNSAYNDQLRNQAIGSTLANSYQGAQNTALTQNQNTISNDLTEGSNQRNLALQTAQAPSTALQAFGALLGLFPQTSTSSGTTSSNTSQVGGLGSLFK